jgi:hypothetical protein
MYLHNYGIPIVENPYIQPQHVGHQIDIIPITRQPRSKRLWKKIKQRRQRNAKPILEDQIIMMGGKMFMHPRVARVLRERLIGAI